MKNKTQIRQIILLLARISATLSLIFLMVMIIGHLFGEEDNLKGIQGMELLAFAFFPVGVMSGLLLAWKKELIGGLITVISLFAFHLITNDYSFLGWIDILAAPGFLYLIYGWMIRKPSL